MIIIKPTLLHNEQSISWGQRGVEQERGAKVVCGHYLNHGVEEILMAMMMMMLVLMIMKDEDDEL